MTDFRKEFDARLPALTTAIENMPGDLDQYAPGLTKARLGRLFQRLSISLGRLDKNGARHPEHLVYGGEPLPTAINSAATTAISHMASGAASFAASSLPVINTLQDQLDRALGTEAEEVKRLKGSVASDLAAAVERSDELMRRVSEHAQIVTDALISTKEQQALLAASVESIRNDAERAAESRRSLEQMVNPDGRSKTSMESLARRARQRITEVDEASERITSLGSEAETTSAAISVARKSADEQISEMKKLRDQAEQILNLSSQAGLAASYKVESDRLQKRSNLFTYVLYGAALLTLAMAAFWVIPGLELAVGRDGQPGDVWKGLSLTLLRASVLAPLVYILYFTTKRISALETLRMDYAEKAAASLSYSGYREQMTNDDDLLRQLKGSLLIKFAEHPERLLRPQATQTTAKVKTPGFEAETSVNVSPDGKKAGAEEVDA